MRRTAALRGPAAPGNPISIRFCVGARVGARVGVLDGVLIGVLIGVSGLPALAQTSAVAPGASSPARMKGPPRPPPVVRPEAVPPVLDLPPEGKVEPQINLPFGKKSGAAASSVPRGGASRAGRAAPGVSDSAARCESEPDATVRAKCFAALAHESPGR